MDGFTVSDVAGLRSPIVIMAFTGWSDTGTVTTDTATRLIESYSAGKFLCVDPEGPQEPQWPKNEAFAARLPAAAPDIVVIRGSEPNLRWRTFASGLVEAL